MHFRRLSMSTSLIFFPPMSISPDVGSKNLNSNLIIVDFLKKPYTIIYKTNKLILAQNFTIQIHMSKNIVIPKILK